MRREIGVGISVVVAFVVFSASAQGEDTLPRYTQGDLDRRKLRFDGVIAARPTFERVQARPNEIYAKLWRWSKKTGGWERLFKNDEMPTVNGAGTLTFTGVRIREGDRFALQFFDAAGELLNERVVQTWSHPAVRYEVGRPTVPVKTNVPCFAFRSFSDFEQYTYLEQAQQPSIVFRQVIGLNAVQNDSCTCLGYQGY